MTFSIVAMDYATGMLGGAIASAVPSVGSTCLHISPGAGAVATQSWVNPYLGIDGLTLLRSGSRPGEVLETLLAEDPDRDRRQVGIVGCDGEPASFTGAECTGWAGSASGSGFAAQGNMLVDESTVTAMVEAYRDGAALDFSERLLAALVAGQRAGGDKRGRQSAALKVCASEEYPLMDVRVDEHQDAVTELVRAHAVVSRQGTPYTKMMPTRSNPRGLRDSGVESMLAQRPELRD